MSDVPTQTANRATDGEFELQIYPGGDVSDRDQNQLVECFFKEANIFLGGDSIELDLSDADYRTSFNRAIAEFRALSTRSGNESMGFLELSPNVQIYRI